MLVSVSRRAIVCSRRYWRQDLTYERGPNGGWRPAVALGKRHGNPVTRAGEGHEPRTRRYFPAADEQERWAWHRRARSQENCRAGRYSVWQAIALQENPQP